MAQAAHRLGPKDRKNVGGELRHIHNRICPSVAVCYTAAAILICPSAFALVVPYKIQFRIVAFVAQAQARILWLGEQLKRQQ